MTAALEFDSMTSGSVVGSSPSACSISLSFGSSTEDSGDEGRKLTQSVPNAVRRFPNPLVLHQDPRHRRQHVVIAIDGLPDSGAFVRSGARSVGHQRPSLSVPVAGFWPGITNGMLRRFSPAER